MIPSSELRFALATAADIEVICALSNSLYARKIAPAYVKWQFFDCPHSPFSMLCWEDDRLICAYGVHVIKTESLTRAMSLDIMVAEHKQGLGLIAPLTQAAQTEAASRGAKMFSVVANDRARHALNARLDWNVWDAISDWTGDNRVHTRAVSCLQLDCMPTRSWTNANTFYPRDADTLAWRTATPRYQHIWLEVSSIGHAVVKIFTDPVTCVGMGDILGLFPFEPKDLEMCILSVQSWFALAKVQQSTIYPIDQKDQPTYAQLGYASTNRPRFFCGVGLAPANIRIGMLDVDVY